MGLGGGVGTGTHLRVHPVERCSQELLVRYFLRDGKSENLNQQRTLGEMHRAMEHSRGHLFPLSKMYSEKNKGFSVLSKFDSGCACAMWADPLLAAFSPKPPNHHDR